MLRQLALPFMRQRVGLFRSGGVRNMRTYTKTERQYNKIQKHANEKRVKDSAKARGLANEGGAVERKSEFAIENLKHTVITHKRPITVDAANSEAASTEGVFAVVELAGTQFKVAPGDVLVCNKLPGLEVGKEFDINDVLLVGGADCTVIGQPRVPEAKVTALMEQQTLEKKVIVFKMKRRQGYRRKNGHRREISVLRIQDIQTGPAYSAAIV